MKRPFTESNYSWNLDGLKRCIKDNKLKSKIVFSTPATAIVHVVSYGESEILGAESTWCISQHKVSWEQYVEKTNGVQLFFYCFNRPVHSDYSLYGATFQVNGDIVHTYCCFTRENNPLGKSRGYNSDEEALHSVVTNEFGKGVFNEVASIIYEIHDNVAKKEVKVTEKKVNKPAIATQENDDWRPLPEYETASYSWYSWPDYYGFWK